eukprot:1160051-Rhodomonas_salina.1
MQRRVAQLLPAVAPTVPIGGKALHGYSAKIRSFRPCRPHFIVLFSPPLHLKGAVATLLRVRRFTRQRSIFEIRELVEGQGDCWRRSVRRGGCDHRRLRGADGNDGGKREISRTTFSHANFLRSCAAFGHSARCCGARASGPGHIGGVHTWEEERNYAKKDLAFFGESLARRRNKCA